jgi:response regulator of citrate/malate metabolism
MSHELGVLVVDDDFMVARIHAGFVDRSPGFRTVGAAHSGGEALDLAADLRPDLILLDVHLPDMSGLEVLARLRAGGNVAGVVMVTAERDVEVVRSALHGGAMQYLVKPFHAEDLARRLGQVREALTALSDADEVDQAAIDRAFESGAGGRADPRSAATTGGTRHGLPKGLSPQTADLVARALDEARELSAADCAERLGLSRVTARRYLEHFVSTGRAAVRLNYGGSGRPEHRYRWEG